MNPMTAECQMIERFIIKVLFADSQLKHILIWNDE